MRYPLTIPSILRRAARVYPEKQIVSRMHDGSLHRYTYAEFYRRVVRLMGALRAAGIRPGDRVATMAWNHYRHLELYFAVPSIGAVLHTVNIRLPAEQVQYILGHAGSRWVFTDRALAAAATFHPEQVGSVERWVVMDDLSSADPATIGAIEDYEALLANGPDGERWEELDEDQAAGLCYTSGTTGDPRGVLYSHRSLYLHAMGLCMVDSLAVSERETVLPVVPMFHVNAWGLPYACAMTGAAQVFPGPHMVGHMLADLIERERVTLAAGVPSVWTALHHYLQHHPHDLSSLRAMVVGGSAAPAALIEAWDRDHGVPIVHAWGMTEVSPVGSVCRLKSAMESLPDGEKRALRMRQGLPIPGIEAALLGDDGRELPWDDRHTGELAVRGPWVARCYFGREGEPDPAFTDDGWFRTGDVARISAEGYIEITDRSKDVIKCRGEWISSVLMENTAMGHPGVLEAAVVGRIHATKGEAPVLFAVRRPDAAPCVTAADLHGFLTQHFQRWQTPRVADIHFVDAIPKTGVGKFDKKVLRARLSG